jgi:predicted kinase
MNVLSFCPEPPAWRVDWPALHDAYPWVRALAGCPQDPIFHAEGDVWIHTRMVCEALAESADWRDLPAQERHIVFAAAVLHDVAKPECTRTEPDGRISSRGHSRRGSVMSRGILWRQAVPFAVREQVTALVRYHQLPYFLIDSADANRMCITASQTARCDHLALLAEADVRGRICQDRQRLLDNVALFREYCREQNCLTTPYAFASAHDRFLHFQFPNRPPRQFAHEGFRADVILMSGLPGSGKDHHIRTHLPEWPVVSLDAIRGELEIEPSETQGAVVNRARELAREHLREMRSFVWNATNLSRQLRRGVIDLFADYNARITIRYVEVAEDVLFAQNRQRPAPVPRDVMDRLIDRWETPDRTEAHEVEAFIRE